MSEEEPQQDDGADEEEKSTLIDTIGETLGFDIDRIKEELEAEDHHETDAIQRKRGPVHLPNDEEIVNLAVEALIEQKQRKKAAKDPSIEDYTDVKVELDIDDPHVVVHSFSETLYDEGEDLLAYLYNHSLFDVTGPSLEADDEELITYIIEERDDDDRPAAFIGGASPLRINLGRREGLSEDERELVRLAHTAAARKNGYDRHLLLDEVLVVPKFEQPSNPYQE